LKVSIHDVSAREARYLGNSRPASCAWRRELARRKSAACSGLPASAFDARELEAGTPEVRKYRLRFWDKGTPNGDWSDIATVTVGPE